MKIGGIILAAGEGTRLNKGQPSEKPKVLYPVGGKPMIFYSLEIFNELGVDDCVIVIGHLGEKVKEAVGDTFKFAVQEEASGTGEAARIGLGFLEKDTQEVLVLYGADIYQKEIIKEMLTKHQKENSVITFLTAVRENPTGLGRILRDSEGSLKAIVEEKVASEEEKKIKEVNDGAYLFKKEWLEKTINNLKLTKVNEVFLTDLIEEAVQEKQKVIAYKIETEGWFGVDTPEQLAKTNEFVEKNWKRV